MLQININKKNEISLFYSIYYIHIYNYNKLETNIYTPLNCIKKLNDMIEHYYANITYESYITYNDQIKNDIKYLLATMNIMAQCKHIICSSGNVSLWILLLRGNAQNVHQSLKMEWVL